MNQKKLLDSQKELLEIRANEIKYLQQQVINAQETLQKAKNGFANLIDRIKIELNIPKNDVKKWEFNKTGNAFICVKQEK